ncbi:MAG TPA: prephenate dehydratase domain-containing protein [Candidatus Saccharimonadales bacterium]|nr:prephenate dehydratase domain-containing protein [Candidatus Saccharimonadales bacterium]
MPETLNATLYEAQIRVAGSILEAIPPASLVTLGPAGSNSDLVARDLAEISGVDPDSIILCGNFPEIIKRVDSGKDYVGVLPVANSIGGDVLHDPRQLLTNAEAIRRASQQILAAVGLPVKHCLLGRNIGITELEGGIVHSNPQALRQCAQYICEKGMTAVDTQSTSAAARALANDELPPESMVIAPPLAGELYGLPILDDNIGDKRAEENVTTMALFSRPDILIPRYPRILPAN